MTASRSRWASLPVEILAAFQAASTPHICISGILQQLPSIVKIQLVCKAWHKAAGRGIAALSMSSSMSVDINILSPSMVLANFPLLVTLHLKVPYVRWSDLQNIKELVHLQCLHLCEYVHSGEVPEDWAFARHAQTTGCLSPFSYVSSLRSLQLELSSRAAYWVWWDFRSLLQPISCMTKLSALTLLVGRSLCNLQHLSQLSHLSSLGISSLEQDVSTLVQLEHLSVKTAQPLDRHQYMSRHRSTEDFSPCLAMLTGLASLDCSSIHWQQIPNLTALTSLTALTVSVSNIVSNVAMLPLADGSSAM